MRKDDSRTKGNTFYRRGTYYIRCRYGDPTENLWEFQSVKGYICEIGGDFAVGICNTVNGKPAGMWTLSILPYGLMFKTFKTKAEAVVWTIEQLEGDKLLTYLREEIGIKCQKMNVNLEKMAWTFPEK